MKFKSETLQGFKQLHTWAGLLAGLFLFIAFFAGSLTVFRDDISRWQFADQIIEIDKALELVTPLIEGSIAIDPSAKEDLIILLPGGHTVVPQAQWRVGPEDIRYAGFNEEGDVNLIEPAHNQLSRFIDELHRNAGIPGIAGEWLMGLAALIYGVALVSGVIMFLPTFARNIFALRFGKNLRRIWLDVHNCLGVLSLPFHIMFALTGAVMCLHDPMLDMMNKFVYPDNGRQLLMETIYPLPPTITESVPADMLPAKTLLENVNRNYPDFEPAVLIYMKPYTQDGTLSIIGHIPEHLAHQTMIVVSPVSGEILGSHLPGNRPDGIVALTGFRALHFGDFGGYGVAWIYLALGLAGAFLFYSGNLLWLESRRRKKQILQKKTHTYLAKLTVAICLGCCLAISSAFLVAKWGLLSGESGLNLLALYWTVILISLLWAWMRSVILATRDLLIAMAVVTISIPGLVLINDISDFGAIESCALVVGSVYFYLAYIAHRRGSKGEEDSVWSIQRSSV